MTARKSGRSAPRPAGKVAAPAERGKREDILRAAVESVVAEGYARTSVSEVARRAGVPRPLVQYYFPTRELMLRAAISRILEDWRAAYFPLPDDPSSGVLDVGRGVQRLWQHMHDPAYSAYLELRSAARTDPALGAILDELDPLDEHRRHQQASVAYTAFAEVDPIAFADARSFTTIFLEGLLQHRFGAAEDSSTPTRQLTLLSDFLTRFWADRGLRVKSGDDRAAVNEPVSVEPGEDFARRADELIALLRGLTKSSG